MQSGTQAAGHINTVPNWSIGLLGLHTRTHTQINTHTHTKLHWERLALNSPSQKQGPFAPLTTSGSLFPFQMACLRLTKLWVTKSPPEPITEGCPRKASLSHSAMWKAPIHHIFFFDSNPTQLLFGVLMIPSFILHHKYQPSCPSIQRVFFLSEGEVDDERKSKLETAPDAASAKAVFFVCFTPLWMGARSGYI